MTLAEATARPGLLRSIVDADILARRQRLAERMDAARAQHRRDVFWRAVEAKRRPVATVLPMRSPSAAR